VGYFAEPWGSVSVLFLDLIIWISVEIYQVTDLGLGHFAVILSNFKRKKNSMCRAGDRGTDSEVCIETQRT
jgi:hypothetical protein